MSGLAEAARTDPLVSIVVPAHNAAATLSAMIASIERQSLTRWEAILVDDGSRDETPALIAAAAARDPRFSAIVLDHSGVSAARNEGIRAARSQWVVFLDSDDELPGDHLAAMLGVASENPEAMVIHAGWRRFSPDAVLISDEPATALDNPAAFCAAHCPFAIHAALVRRDALRAAGGFDETLTVCEDWDLWQRLAQSGARFVAAPGRQVDVRMRRNSVSSDGLRLFAEGLRRIERGFARQEHALRQARSEAVAFHALWSIGNVIGQHGDVESALALVQETELVGAVSPHEGAVTLVGGILVGAGQPLICWPKLWPAIADDFDRFIAWLDARAPETRQGGWLRFAVEQHVGALLGDLGALEVGRLSVVTLDPARPLAAVPVAPRTDRLRVRLDHEGNLIGDFEILVDGHVSRETLAEAIGMTVPAAELAGLASAPPPPRSRWSRLRSAFGRTFSSRAVPAPSATSADPDRFEAVLAEVAMKSQPQSSGETGEAAWTPPDYSAPEYWEVVFATRDPWEYENSYEARKYLQTMAMLGEDRPDRALEIACAEGHFTLQLAERAGHVLATDISATAVERASQRCAALNNVSFAQLDLARDEIPGRFDLIVCSEVLYYMPDRAALDQVVAKFAGALEDGGSIVLAHGNLLVDEPDRTGFPWPHDFGAKGIGEAFAAHPLLQLESEYWTPLYRIQRLRRCDAPIEATTIIGDAAPRLPDRVARQIRWRGGQEAPPAAEWNKFPILMYHQIAESGPKELARYRLSAREFEAQLDMLRCDGWTGITLPNSLPPFAMASRCRPAR